MQSFFKMFRIKKNDIVMITSGKDKGKSGRVLQLDRDASCALVEGINLVKKHVRRIKDSQQGGIMQVERPLPLSNIMPFCKNCNRPVKVGYRIAQDKTKSRFCRRCSQSI